jgi:hypothetical protein
MCQQQNFLQIMLDSLLLIGSAHASCLSFRRCVAAAGSVPLECSCKLRSERGCTEGKVTLGLRSIQYVYKTRYKLQLTS